MQSSQPIAATRLVLDLDHIREYDRNLRRERNPLWQEIKDSICARGLDQPLPVTRRPGEEHYMIRAGGNTRLLVLKELYQETCDPRFKEVDCLFTPWRDEADTLVAHLVELRGDLLFIDKARAVLDLRGLLEQETGGSITQTALSAALRERGFKLDQPVISRMEYAVEVLWPIIPAALRAGMGKPQVERIRALEKALGKFLESRKKDPEEIEAARVWLLECLSGHDGPDWSLEPVQQELADHLAEVCAEPVQWVRLDLEALVRGGYGDARIAPHVPTPLPEVHAFPPAPNPSGPTVPSLHHVPAAEDTEEDLAGDAETWAGEDDSTGPPVETGALVEDQHPGGDAGESMDNQEHPGASDPAARILDMHTVAAAPEGLGLGLPMDPKSLRARMWTLATRLAQRNGLDGVHPLQRGIGFFIDLPAAPLAPRNQSPNDDPTTYKRALLWWLLTSLSEQFVHGHDHFRGLVTHNARLFDLVAAIEEDEGAAFDQAVAATVGVPTIDDLGQSLFARLDERDLRDLTMVLTTRCALQVAAERAGHASPWEM